MPIWLKRIGGAMLRWLGRLFILLAALLALAVTVLMLAQLTETGRATVLRLALPEINALIPGSVQARRLGRLDPWGIELWGIRVQDPQGQQVLELEHAFITTDLALLLRGTIGLKMVILEQGKIDAQEREQGRGLLAAFVDPEAKPTPPSEAPPTDIVIKEIELRALTVELPSVATLGQVTLEVGELASSFSLLNGTPGAALRLLRLRASRLDDELLSLDLTGKLIADQGVIDAKIQANSGPISLHYQGRMPVPTEANWQQIPLQCELTVSGVTARQLAKVANDPELNKLFLGEASFTLRALGTAENTRVDGELVSAAGSLRLDELQFANDKLRLNLSTPGLILSKLRAELPSQKIALQLIFESKGLPPAPVEANISIRKATVDNEELIDLDAQGTWTGAEVKGFSLKGRSGDSRISLGGTLGLKTSTQLHAQLDLRSPIVKRLGHVLGENLDGRVQASVQLVRSTEGELSAEGSLLADELVRTTQARGSAPVQQFSVQHVGVRFNTHGTPPNLKVQADGTLDNACAATSCIDSAKFEVDGDPQTLDLKLSAKGGLGAKPEQGQRDIKTAADINLSAHVGRTQGATHLIASGSGLVSGQIFELELGPTQVEDQGGIKTQGLVALIAGQRLSVEGELKPTGSSQGLRAHFGPIRLATISALGLELPPLMGEVEGNIELTGSVALPIVVFDAKAKAIRLAKKPPIDISARGKFDSKAGKAEYGIEFSSSSLVKGSSKGLISFSSGTNFQKNLAQASGEIGLTIERLDSEFLAPYLEPTVLPFGALLRTQLKLSGSLSDPKAEMQGTLDVDTQSESPVQLAVQLDYARAKLRSKLAITDARGEWANLLGTADLLGAAERSASQTPSVSELIPLLQEALSQAQWDLQFKSNRRPVSDIPLVHLAVDPQNLPAIVSEISFDASHLPKQEPELKLRLLAEQDSKVKIAGCSTDGLALELLASHLADANVVQLVGRKHGSELLRFKAGAQLAIAPLLSGRSSKPGPVNISLHTETLDIASLPFVCDRAAGQVSLLVEGKDILSKDPHILAQATANGLTLGSRERVDVKLAAHASSKWLDADLKLSGVEQGSKARGSLNLKLPWTFSEGRATVKDNTEVKARLNLVDFPIAPFLPPQGPISYARGTIDSNIRLQGKLKAPMVYGQLKLNQVAFTSTAVAQPLRDVNGRIQFSGRRLSLLDFEAHDQDGVLKLNGELDISDMQRITSKLQIRAKNFPLRQMGQVVAVTNLNATATSTVTPQATRAELTFHDVDTWLEQVAVRSGIDLEPHEEFVIDGHAVKGSPLYYKILRGSASNDVAARAEKSKIDQEKVHSPILINIDAHERFWVKRDDFAVKLSALLDTKVVGDDVRIKGDVAIERGYLQLFGKVFDLKRESAIRFISSSPPNPVLELEAEHKTRAGKQVLVRITGRGDSPILTFLIDGDEVDAGIAVQTLFGGEKNGGNTDASAQAQSFVSGLTAGLLATAARKELGAAAPILMIDPADKAGEGRVRAGFELDQLVPKFLQPIVTGVYLEGVVARESNGNAAATTQFGALLEVYFPKKLFTAGQYGPGTTWSIDFGWQL